MFSALAHVVIAAVSINSSNAQTLMESARALQAERWADVNNYTVTISVEASGGLETPMYYEKIGVDGQPTFRMVPPGEYNRKLTAQAGFPADPAMGKEMAGALGLMGGAMATGGGDMPPMDISGMTAQMSAFALAGSQPLDDGKSDARDAVSDMAEFASRARLEGKEQILAVSGESNTTREAFVLVADNLSDIALEQPDGEAHFSLRTMSLWIDAEHLVPLRLLMEGEVDNEGKKMPMTIEKLDLDYKQVGPLYESHCQVYRLSGLMANMSDKDRKKMEEARVEMAKAKEQLAKMPAAQKAMVEKMMKGQMEKFEAMMAGDAISTTTKVVSIAINEGPPTAAGPGDLTVGGPAAATYPGALTVAVGNPNAELAIAAQLQGQAEAIIGLIGAVAFPGPGQVGQVEISGATGSAVVLFPDTVRVAIEKGTGVITVTERTETRIAGTFTALLTGRSSKDTGDNTVDFEASGKFDTGAPAGALKSFRGSPIPVDLFENP